MRTKRTKKESVRGERPGRPLASITLQALADHLDLSATTVSLVLNGSPRAKAIPEPTQERVRAAARRFNYRPNPIARSLRSQRTHTIGVLLPDLGDPYATLVLSGIEDCLVERSYAFLLGCHRRDATAIARHTQTFLDRRVDGLLFIGTPPSASPSTPAVAISRHEEIDGVTNIVLDHERAATLALECLVSLGHRRIAVLKGAESSSDADVRWEWIARVASRLGAPIPPALMAELDGESLLPEPGYRATRQLLERREPFSALFAFNDMAAIGSIRALREAGLRIPRDISVVGFDDWHGTAFHHPPLTTVRQPLAAMGRLAAETLLAQIAGGPAEGRGRTVLVEPELVLRQSIASAKTISIERMMVRLA